MTSPTPSLPERIESKIAYEETTGCWLWTGSLRNGYGAVWWQGRMHRAHRLIYSLLVGPIPKDKVLAHRCFTKACVNPIHVRPATLSENRLDTDVLITGTAAHFVCGHVRSDDNTVHWRQRGGLTTCCRLCRQAYQRRWRLARKEASLVAFG